MNLNKLASQFHTADFIKDDPVQFPHLYKEKTDIEISALISSWIAYGSRVQIIKTLNKIHQEFLESPTNYIKEKKYQHYQNQEQCLYRFYQEKDFFQLCETLHTILFEENFSCLEDKIQSLVCQKPTAIEVLEAITKIFPNQKGIPQNTKSACKRLCLFLRWMIRKNSEVDFGIWNILQENDLIIPLDTHVFRISKQLGLTNRKQADMLSAIQITDKLKITFPDDPLLGDYALFGYGVKHQEKTK